MAMASIRHKRHGESAVLCAFDLIELDGEDLRRSSIEYRKRKLAKLVARCAHMGIVLNEHYEGDNVELFRKCFELMNSLMPAGATIAVLLNPANIPQTATERATVQDAARALGAHVVILNASSPGEIESAFETLVGQRVGALVVSGETFFLTQRNRLVELAARHALPTIYAYREFPVAGGLMSYGSDFTEPYRLLGVYAGRILKGEKPADLPVQQATKVELVINLKTAQTLGLSIPLPLLGRADLVIE